MKNLVQITTKQNNALQMTVLHKYWSNVKSSLILEDKIIALKQQKKTSLSHGLILLIPAKTIKKYAQLLMSPVLLAWTNNTAVRQHG